MIGDKFRREQLYYNSSSDFRKKYTVNQEDYSETLNEAFLFEYGYTFDQFVRVTFDLILFGNEKENGDIFVEEKNNLIVSLIEADSELSYELVLKVLDDISLVERDDFLKPPSKFKSIDVYPWRFKIGRAHV